MTSRCRFKRTFKRVLLAGLGVGVLGAWGSGFGTFVDHVRSFPPPARNADLPPTQAIVVLTGGSGRIEEGLALLAEGKGKKLLISGVGPGGHHAPVLDKIPLAPDLQACCITLGSTATSTLGNVEETRRWLKVEGFSEIRLVTANYHMPRSLLLFSAGLPNVTILPYALVSSNVPMDPWWSHPATASLLASEYTKYLISLALIRLRESLTK